MHDHIHKFLESSDLFTASLTPEWKKVEVELDHEIEELIKQFESTTDYWLRITIELISTIIDEKVIFFHYETANCDIFSYKMLLTIIQIVM